MLTVASVLVWIVLQDPTPPAPSAPKEPPATAEQLTAAIENATAELTKLAPRRHELPRGTWHEAELKMTTAVQEFVASAPILEWEHVARGIQTTWRAQCPGACAMLCDLALERFEPDAGMHAQLGMCKMALAQEAELEFDGRRYAAQAAVAFAASRKLGECEPAFVLMCQALMLSLDFDAALADFDMVLGHPKFGAELNHVRHGGRALFLLVAGRAAEAVKECEAAAASDEDPDPVLLVRALALAGRKDDAVGKARELWRESPTPIHLTVLADVLAFAGHYDEALALSRDHPVEQGKLSEKGFAALRRTRAALEYLIGLHGKRPADLREQLVKVLEHEVKVGSADGLIIHHGTDADAEPPTNLSESPIAIGSWMLRQPSSAISWANYVLFAVCVDDEPKWSVGVGTLESGLLERLLPAGHWQAITGDDAAKKSRAMVAGQLMFGHSEGILTATHLLGPAK